MKNLVRLFVVSAALSVAAASQAVLISGTATGLFSNGSATSLGALNYQAGTFSANTDMPQGGFFAVGGDNLADSFGRFSLTGTPTTFGPNTTFTLFVTFTSPAGVSPSNPTYTAALTGRVTNASSGGVKIDFGGAEKSFKFDGGTFTLGIDNLSITPSRAGFVTGSGVVSTPAPGAVASFGVAALATIRRRRRASK